jgi:hypothetical protein
MTLIRKAEFHHGDAEEFGIETHLISAAQSRGIPGVWNPLSPYFSGLK